MLKALAGLLPIESGSFSIGGAAAVAYAVRAELVPSAALVPSAQVLGPAAARLAGLYPRLLVYADGLAALIGLWSGRRTARRRPARRQRRLTAIPVRRLLRSATLPATPRPRRR